MNKVAQDVDRYVLNVTNWPARCFHLVDSNGEPITDVRFDDDRCRGMLVGVYHEDGNAAEREFVFSHQTWHEKFRAIRNPMLPCYCDDNGIPETPWEPSETEDEEDDKIWD